MPCGGRQVLSGHSLQESLELPIYRKGIEYLAGFLYEMIANGVARPFSNDGCLRTAVKSLPSTAMAFVPNVAVHRGGYSQEDIYSERATNSFSLSEQVEDDSATPLTSPSRSPSPFPSPSLQRTLLDKPLAELTEEDIMHLTREDCRRYLKQKGMRRPSWNKSQAIQQVLSLKGLFDSNDDEEKNFQPLTGPWKPTVEPARTQKRGAKSRASIHRTQTETVELSFRPSASILKVATQACTNYVEPSGGQERKEKDELSRDNRDLPLRNPNSKVSVTLGGLSKGSSAYACMDQIMSTSLELKERVSPQLKSCSQFVQESGLSGMEQSSQLTIFYSGMVNVYDNVPENKARDVMLLAEMSNRLSPSLRSNVPNFNFGQFELIHGGDASSRSMPHYVASTIATTEFSSTQARPSQLLPIPQSLKLTQLDYQPSRKACLQRYLKKRRSRNVRNPCSSSSRRVDCNVLLGQLMSQAQKLNSLSETVDPSSAHSYNVSHVQPPTESASGSEISSSTPLRSCPSL